MRPARAILYLRRFPMPEAAKKLKRKSEARIRLLSQPPLDWPLAIIVLTLVVFGLVMLFSASYATAYYRFKGDSFHFIRQQALFAAVGVVVMFVASHVDYHIFHKFAWPIMAVTVVLLIVVLFMPELNGAKRWIFLPIGGNLQPSEVAKFAVIVLFAHIISINHKRMKTFAYGVLPFVVILGVIAGLMLLEPHLSGTVLILGIGGLMMFVGGTGLVWFGLAIAGVVAGVAGRCAGAGPCALCHEPHRKLAEPVAGRPGRRPPDHPEHVRHRLGRADGPWHRQLQAETPVPARAAERLYFLRHL